MKVATYKNRQLGETYELAGVKNIGDAWDKAEIVCNQKAQSSTKL